MSPILATCPSCLTIPDSVPLLAFRDTSATSTKKLVHNLVEHVGVPLSGCGSLRASPLSNKGSRTVGRSPSQTNLRRSAQEKGGLLGLPVRGRGQESEINRWVITAAFATLFCLSLVPEHCVRSPTSSNSVRSCNGALWAGNSTVIPWEQRCHIGMAQGGGLSRHLDCWVNSTVAESRETM
jgi:hypothetical protein